ncbi:Sec-independent protein translocase protein TatB [uncultured Sphingomonas sp.]|uniref:Sec-independent protein translocase protein TatB n=1 Tax=uncultured Sphingomonas sp. TaxID=158754 RepID=UPI0035CA3241
MFDIAPSELLLVAVVALVVIGPKDLPKALRVLGYWVGRARGVARQFRAGFDEMVRESELAEMEKKWASENERIMREHDGGAEADVAASPAPEIAAAEPVTADRDEPTLPPSEPSDAAELVDRAAVHARMRESRGGPPVADAPVMVERPHVAPAPGAATPPADPASS